MPIIGIDYSKCNKCQICIDACYVGTRCFRLDEKQDKILFGDKENLCYLCGLCISKCPADAIIHEDMGGTLPYDDAQDPTSSISYESLHKFLISKRSRREFVKRKIPRDFMKKVLDSIKYAPAGANIRTLKCTIISDDKLIKKLSDVIMDEIIVSTGEKYRTYRDEGYKDYRKQGIDRIFFNAPHVLFFHSNNLGDAMNAPIGITYGMLSAQSLGLGSCWIGLAQGVLNSYKNLKQLVGIQDILWGVIILGYPTKQLKSYRTPPRPDLIIKGLEEL